MNIKDELRKYAKSDEIEEKFAYFHKTGKGGYAEKDIFIGVTVPGIRKVANEYYKDITLKETEDLLHSNYHEERLLALIILTYKMKKAKENEQKEIIELYKKIEKDIKKQYNNLNGVEKRDLINQKFFKKVGWIYEKEKN